MEHEKDATTFLADKTSCYFSFGIVVINLAVLLEG